MLNKLKARGFTLIELLVVIAIIGILSSVVLASLNSAREKSRDARRVSDINSLRVALELYFDSNGEYPDALSGLSSGGQIPVVPTDPNGGSYTYDNQTSAGAECLEASGACTTYHIAAVLEDTSHTALDTDADVDSSATAATNGFDGTSTDCAGTAGTDACYDIQP